MNAPPLPPPLVALSPGSLLGADGGELLARADAAIAAGLRGILLREPRLADGATLELAAELAARLSDAGGWLGVHDRLHLVAAARAHAGHVGFRSLAPGVAREVLAPEHALGFSSHAGDGPDEWGCADYRFLGPVHDTPSKRGVREPLGSEAFAAELAARAGGPPTWAIGGITPERTRAVRAAGARGVAVRAGLLGAEDPAAATRAYLAALEGAEAPR